MHANRSGRTYRTLRESEELDQWAAHYLGRMPRNQREAGLTPRTHLEWMIEDDNDSALRSGTLTLWLAAIFGVASVSLVVWLVLR